MIALHTAYAASALLIQLLVLSACKICLNDSNTLTTGPGHTEKHFDKSTTGIFFIFFPKLIP